MTTPPEQLTATVDGAQIERPTGGVDSRERETAAPPAPVTEQVLGSDSAPVTEQVDSESSESPMLRAALDLFEVTGWPIVPAHFARAEGRCSCGNECSSPGKHPRFPRWQQRALRTVETIRAHWSAHPRDNFGIATGSSSGVVVLDVDGAEGERSLAALVAVHGALPIGPSVRTARGVHYYFAAGSVPLRNRAGAGGRGLGVGLDLRAEGGFVIVPPSVHASKFVYVWAAGLHVGQVALPAVPEWIVEAACDRTVPEHLAPPPDQVEQSAPALALARVERWADAALRRECERVQAAKKGTRNGTLNEAAFNLGTIVGGGALDASEVWQHLLPAALQSGLDRGESVKTITSGLRAGMARPRSAPNGNGSNGNGHAAYAVSTTHVCSSVHAGSAGETRASSVGDSASNEPAGPSEPDVTQLPDGPTTTPDALPTPRIEIINTTHIFEPLPPQRWAVPDLQLGPGRPTLIVGYGASAKSISSQALALAVAAGRPIFGRFDCSPMTVLHVDYEQGETDTRRRYQRLAHGMGVDPSTLEQRLHLAAMPRLRLYATDKDAEDQFRRIVHGVDLLIVDSFRASSRSIDENDSDAREIIDMWTRLSLTTGAAILLIHHCNKSSGDRDRDVRAAVRGSSGIFDACGAVFLFDRKPGKPATRVRMIKSPTSARGGAIEPFELLVEDVACDGDAAAGVRVVWRETSDDEADADETARAYEVDAARLLRVVERQPGKPQCAIVSMAGMKKPRALEVLRGLEDEGRVSVTTGPKGAKTYWPVGGEP